jgi:hypothetical protein
MIPSPAWRFWATPFGLVIAVTSPEPLDDPDALGGKVALLTEADHEDPGAGPERRGEERERGRVGVGAAPLHRLVGVHHVSAHLRVHALATREGDDDLQLSCHERPPMRVAVLLDPSVGAGPVGEGSGAGGRSRTLW